MIIKEVIPQDDLKLLIISEDGLSGEFDVSPYVGSEAFASLADPNEFRKVTNGRYFIEWQCGADLSADTIAAHWDFTDAEVAEKLNALNG